MKIIILCGGRGVRLAGEASYIPKAMVRLGHRPLLWHVMKRYALFGYNDFILALGAKGEMIRDYFINYKTYVDNIRISLSKPESFESLTTSQESEWKITMIDTGEQALTGARIARCKRYLDEGDFMVTYADCLADIDINKLMKFHKRSSKVATISGVVPPYRIGELMVENNLAVGFYDARHQRKTGIRRYINGGYMIFKKEIFSYLSLFNECQLETEVFEKLMKSKELAIFPHHGFWRWLDTDRDYIELSGLVDKNKLFWLQN